MKRYLYKQIRTATKQTPHYRKANGELTTILSEAEFFENKPDPIEGMIVCNEDNGDIYPSQKHLGD